MTDSNNKEKNLFPEIRNGPTMVDVSKIRRRPRPESEPKPVSKPEPEADKADG